MAISLAPMRDTPHTDLANRVVELRKAIGYTRNELADKVGVSRQAIRLWERGAVAPTGCAAVWLARALCVEVDQLLGEKPVTFVSHVLPDGALERLRSLPLA
jgi:DNA-binding XRE family transcriptional regulator